MTNVIEKTFLLGLGVLTLTREKVAKAVDELVHEGRIEATESRKLIDDLVTKGEEERAELSKLIRSEVEKARGAAPVSRQEFDALKARVDALAGQAEEPKEEGKE
ncbi:MAG: hypothetical protein JXD18_07245 [Anaerolineae bacterium]|nr:hypothetical protein [Anaerolineae bacterium]